MREGQWARLRHGESPLHSAFAGQAIPAGERVQLPSAEWRQDNGSGFDSRLAHLKASFVPHRPSWGIGTVIADTIRNLWQVTMKCIDNQGYAMGA